MPRLSLSLLLRLLQGLSAAGEQSGANSLTLEHSANSNRAFFTSWTLSGTQAGAILATLVFIPIASMPEDQLLSWGWRIPFLLSALVLLVAYLVRRTMPETPVFEDIKDKAQVARFPVVMLLRDYWPDVLRVITCALIATVSTMTAVFTLGYATSKFGVARPTMLWAGVLGNVDGADHPALLGPARRPHWPQAGLHRRRARLRGADLPVLHGDHHGQYGRDLCCGAILSGVIYTAPNAIWPSFYAEMFETRVRYSGTAIGTQLGFLVAGFTPLVSQSLVGEGPYGWMPVAIFVACCCVISAAAAATAREIAAGTAYATHGVNTIPFFIYYSMFGFQRIGDLIWAAGDSRTRGFLLGGTVGPHDAGRRRAAASGRQQPAVRARVSRTASPTTRRSPTRSPSSSRTASGGCTSIRRASSTT